MSLTTNLVSYWKLEETTGNRIDAVVSSGNDLTEVNTVGYSGGIIGNAASLVAANSEILVITNANQTGLSLTGNHSYSFWIKQASVPQYSGLICKGDGYISGYSLDNFSYGNTMYVNFASASTVYAQWGAANVLTSADIGNWVHIVATVDIGSATGGIIYKNGVAQTMSAKSGTSTGPISSNTLDFILGSNSTSTQYIDGIMDEVGVWSRVLTPTEVTYLYNSGAPGVAQQYPFEVPKRFSPLPSHYNT